jgi:hypothetical protein
MEVKMSSELWRIILAVVIASHGIGHTLFLVPCLGIAKWGQTSQSWLLTDLIGDTPTRAIGSVMWSAVTVGFMVAGFGIFGQQSWWRTMVIGSCILSLFTLGLFARGLIQSALNATAFDVIILAALLLAHWPSQELIGS